MNESSSYFFENIIFVSQLEAIAEFQAHGFNSKELFEELGEHQEYEASEVLTALGY